MIDDNDGFISTVTSESESKYDSSEVAYKFDASPLYDRTEAGLPGGDGEVIIDGKRVVERDDRGLTRTGFLSSDVDTGILSETVVREGSTYTYAQWLMTLQDGFRSPKRKEHNEQADTSSYIDIFSGQMELTDYQHSRVEAVIDSINMSHMAHYSREALIMAAISIVANEDNRWIRDESRFKKLVSEVGSTMHDIKNARKLLKRKSPLL